MRATSDAFSVCLSFSSEMQQNTTDASWQDKPDSLDAEPNLTGRLDVRPKPLQAIFLNFSTALVDPDRTPNHYRLSANCQAITCQESATRLSVLGRGH